MTSYDFTRWLRGFVDATAGYAPTQAQWQTIAAKLADVDGPKTLDNLKQECDKRDAAQADPVKPCPSLAELAKEMERLTPYYWPSPFSITYGSDAGPVPK